jgi:hypothetical protein
MTDAHSRVVRGSQIYFVAQLAAVAPTGINHCKYDEVSNGVVLLYVCKTSIEDGDVLVHTICGVSE